MLSLWSALALAGGLSLVAGCRAHPAIPADAGRLFADWWINPAPATQRALTDLRLSFTTWDSIAASARATTVRKRRDVVTLTYPASRHYAVGYETPPTIRPGARYPLILYLHGGVAGAASTKGQDAFAMLAPLADSLELFIASPTATRDAPWWDATGLERILQTLRYMTLHFPIDPDRVVLAGVSDGALGCYAAAECIAGPFAGFIPISGFGGLLPAAGIPLIPGNLARSPFYAIYAGRDRLFAAEDMRRFLAWMKDQHVDVDASFHPDEGHGFDYRASEYGAIAARVRLWSRDHGPDISWTFVPGHPVRARNVISVALSPAADSLPSLDARFTGDTLRVVSRGMSRVTMRIDGARFPRGFRVRTGDGRVSDAVRLDPASRPEVYFDLMQSTCFPRIEGGTAWSFTTR